MTGKGYRQLRLDDLDRRGSSFTDEEKKNDDAIIHGESARNNRSVKLSMAAELMRMGLSKEAVRRVLNLREEDFSNVS